MSDEERDDDKAPENESELLRWSEKTQRKIDFIVNQQAQFTTDMQALRESQERTDAVVRRFANATFRRFEGVESEVSNLDRKIEALVDAQIRSEDEMKELREAQKNTDGRLNAFISTVERLITERRNGGGKGGVLDE